MARALRPAEEQLLQQRASLEGVCLAPVLAALCAALRRSRALLVQGGLLCLYACARQWQGVLAVSMLLQAHQG